MKDIIKKNAVRPPNEQQKFSFKGDQFFVDGHKVVDAISAPLLQDVLNLNKEQREKLDTYKFFESSVQEEKNSKFFAFSTSISCMDHITEAYLKLCKDFPTASHICLGYRIDAEDGSPLQGAVHDGEYQADVTLLDAMFRSSLDNLAVFVIRRYGGINIGGRRLTLIRKVAVEALNALRANRGDVLPATEEEVEDADDSLSGIAPPPAARPARNTVRRGRGGTVPCLTRAAAMNITYIE